MDDSRGKTVLVVDDEPDIQFYLKTILENAGFDVMVASNGKQALDRVKDRKPDVISLDLVMPKMSGLKFYQYLQKNPEKADIPCVIVTAHGKDDFGSKDLSRLQEEGAGQPLYYLEKPVKPSVYVNTIREAMGLSAVTDDSEERESLLIQLQDKMKNADTERLKEALRALV